jgi:hypothetical protein
MDERLQFVARRLADIEYPFHDKIIVVTNADASASATRELISARSSLVRPWA